VTNRHERKRLEGFNSRKRKDAETNNSRTDWFLTGTFAEKKEKKRSGCVGGDKGRRGSVRRGILAARPREQQDCRQRERGKGNRKELCLDAQEGGAIAIKLKALHLEGEQSADHDSEGKKEGI